MSDNIEVINGVGSFASFREPAWHNLGEVFTDEVTTAEMLSKANLHNWNVRVEEMVLPDGYTTVNPAFMVVRNHPSDGQSDVLATVGKRYVAVQNEDLFQFADNLLDGGRWETAGSIKNGRVVFGSLALNREIVIDESGVNDKINTYLLVHTSHDGSVAVQASVTPVRVVCQNTLNQALRGVKQSYKVRHTSTVDGRIASAREALGLAHTYLDKFELEAKSLYEAEINKTQFDKIINLAYPRPEKDAKGSIKKWETKYDLLEEIYGGDTNGMISGTAWGAYNALTERLDWYRTGRGGNNESVMASASGFDAVTNAEKGKLLQIVKQVAGVK
jgi:phage/plasmid-like protein (TIGR03299 family)